MTILYAIPRPIRDVCFGVYFIKRAQSEAQKKTVTSITHIAHAAMVASSNSNDAYAKGDYVRWGISLAKGAGKVTLNLGSRCWTNLTTDVSQNISACSMIETAIHIAIAALSLWAIHSVSSVLAAATIITVTAVASLPSIVLVTGSWLLYHGITSTISCFALGAFTALPTNLAGLAVGWILLEIPPMFLEYGLLDKRIESIASSLNSSVIAWATR